MTKKTYASAWNHAFKLWQNYLSSDKFNQFDRFLASEFAKNSQYGSQDRRWYSDVLFAAIRHSYFALFCIHLFPHPYSPAAIISFKDIYQNPVQILQALRSVDLIEFFSWIYLRSDLVNKTTFLGDIDLYKSRFYQELIKLQQKEDLEYKFIFYSIPLYFIPFWQERVKHSNFNSQDADKFLANLNTKPPLWLRLNHVAQKEIVVSQLQQNSYNLEFHPQNIAAIAISGLKGIFNLSSYQKGLFEIQDLASQGIGNKVTAKPKQYIWDCCAGGGGKTLQLASILQNKGVIYASDIRSYKLEEIKKRAKRAGFFNIRCLSWDGKTLPNFPKEIQLKNGFDRVLVDSPCSATGTWRRNPDAKYKIDNAHIIDLIQLQLSILSAASAAVLLGGQLIYATCSWLVIENEELVQNFLLKHQHFCMLEQQLIGSPQENSDTMFVAIFKRIK